MVRKAIEKETILTYFLFQHFLQTLIKCTLDIRDLGCTEDGSRCYGLLSSQEIIMDGNRATAARLTSEGFTHVTFTM